MNDRPDDDEALYGKLQTAIRSGHVVVYTDQHQLSFQGSPVHRSEDHLIPLLVTMGFALLLLLLGGLLAGLAGMALGAVLHWAGASHFVAWRIRTRTQAYLLSGLRSLEALWKMGGVAVGMKDSNEPPCLAPRGDWRRFVRRNLLSNGAR